MQIYEVRISRDALQDMARLRAFLLEMMSEDGAVRYANNMRAEIKMLSLFAGLYGKTTSKTLLAIHPEARRMISHNRRWIYVFHTPCRDDFLVAPGITFKCIDLFPDVAVDEVSSIVGQPFLVAATANAF